MITIAALILLLFTTTAAVAADVHPQSIEGEGRYNEEPCSKLQGIKTSIRKFRSDFVPVASYRELSSSKYQTAYLLGD